MHGIAEVTHRADPHGLRLKLRTLGTDVSGNIAISLVADRLHTAPTDGDVKKTEKDTVCFLSPASCEYLYGA
jgi:hypothetical protein